MLLFGLFDNIILPRRNNAITFALHFLSEFHSSIFSYFLKAHYGLVVLYHDLLLFCVIANIAISPIVAGV